MLITEQMLLKRNHYAHQPTAEWVKALMILADDDEKIATIRRTVDGFTELLYGRTVHQLAEAEDNDPWSTVFA